MTCFASAFQILVTGLLLLFCCYSCPFEPPFSDSAFHLLTLLFWQQPCLATHLFLLPRASLSCAWFHYRNSTLTSFILSCLFSAFIEILSDLLTSFPFPQRIQDTCDILCYSTERSLSSSTSFMFDLNLFSKPLLLPPASNSTLVWS